MQHYLQHWPSRTRYEVALGKEELKYLGVRREDCNEGKADYWVDHKTCPQSNHFLPLYQVVMLTVFNSNLFLYKSITLNPSASANLKLQVNEKWLSKEWIWGQQDSLEHALAYSSHNYPVASILGGTKKLLLLHIFGYKNLFVMAGIQSWCSCCLLTWGWPINCYITTSLPPSASPFTWHYVASPATNIPWDVAQSITLLAFYSCNQVAECNSLHLWKYIP